MAKPRSKMKKLSKGRTIATSQGCNLNNDCTSSDALSIYYHDDEKVYSAFCYSCKDSCMNYDYENNRVKSYKKKEYSSMEESSYLSGLVKLPTFENVSEDFIAIDSKERRIRASTYDFIGVKHDFGGVEGDTIDVVYYPVHSKGDKLTGYTVRERFPKGHEKEGILKYFKRKVGETSGSVQLVGQNLYKAGNKKRCILTEGVEDMATVITMLCRKLESTPENIPFAVLSVPHGSNVKAIKDNLEYLSSFEEIMLNIDSDEAGKDFEEKCTKILPVGKVRLVRLPDTYKDASDMWKDLKTAKQLDYQSASYWKLLWASQKWSPAGIFGMSEGWSDYLKRGTEALIPFPEAFGEVNEKTHGGYALGEIINIAGASGSGKSSFTKEMIYTALTETDYNIGICSFEETLGEFIEGFLSIHMSTQLNEIPDDSRDRDKEFKAFGEMLSLRKTPLEKDSDISPERIHYLDDQGSVSGEALIEKINFLIKGCDCKIIIIDPVTLALSNSGMEPEEYTSEMVKLVKREDVALIQVHHVRKSSNGAKANSEGADLNEEDIHGAGCFFQTGMINFLIMRNKNHENPVIRNTSKLKLSKIRRHGKNTGFAGYTFYDGDTGRLERGFSEEDILETYDGFDEVS